MDDKLAIKKTVLNQNFKSSDCNFVTIQIIRINKVDVGEGGQPFG